MLDRATGLHDFIGRHRGITDKHHFVIVGVFVHQIECGRALIETPDIVLPNALVDEVVEVKILEVLKLRARRRKQLFTDLDVGIHGSTDIEEQQYFHRIVALGHHFDVQQSGVTRRGFNRVVEVELFGCPGAGKFAQTSHGDFDIPRAELDAIVQIFEIPTIPHLHCTLVFTLTADADPLRMEPIIAKGRRALGANPFVATGVPLFLLFKTFLELLNELLKPPQTLDFGLVLLGELLHEFRAQPVIGNHRLDHIVERLKILKMQAKSAIKAIVVLLVFDENRSG